MTFTEEDADNDGLIKREAGREMAKQAKTHNPEMYEYFEDVCAEIGREPANVFGEMAIKALESEAYANQLLQAEISMADLRANEIRMEDVQFVTDLADQLGLNDTKEQKDPIQQLVEKRVQSVASSPLSQFNREESSSGEVAQEVASHLEALNSKIERLENRVSDNEGREVQGTTESDDSQSVGDLFGDDDGEDEEPTQVEVVEQETTEPDDTEQEDDGEPEEEEETEILDPDIALNNEPDGGDQAEDQGGQEAAFSSEDAVPEDEE